MNTRIATFIIVLSFIFDAVNSMMAVFNPEYYRFSIFFRAALEIYLLVLFMGNPRFTQYYRLIFFLVITYTVGHLFYISNVSEFAIINTGECYIILNKYLLIVVISMMFYSLKDEPDFQPKLRWCMDLFFITNIFIIFLGVVFNVRALQTYFDPDALTSIRFGYKSLIPAQNEVTGVYFIGLAYYFRGYFKYGEKILWKLLAVAVCAFMSGTKGSWIALVLLGTYYIYQYRRKKFLSLFLPMVVIVAIVWGRDLWEFFYENVFYYFRYYIEEEELSTLTILFTKRDILTVEVASYVMQNWTPINFLFGGTDVSTYLTETDLLDGFFMFGMGFIVYLAVYIKLFLSRDHSRDNVWTLLFFLAIASTGGHLIYSAIVPMYLMMFIYTSRVEAPGVSKIVQGVGTA